VRAVRHPARGVYHIAFNQDVSACAATASIRGERNNILPGYVVVSNFNTDKVGVNTYNAATLLPADFKFNMVVNC
jgi:hypothetical protein